MARGQPDEATYSPQVQPEDLPRKIVPRMESAPPTGLNAISGAVNSIDQKYQADTATWAGDQIAQARTKALQDLEQAKANAPAGDQTGFTAKYLQGFDKNNQQLIQSSDFNPMARKMVERGLGDLRQTLDTNTRQWEAQQNVAYRNDALQSYVKSQSAVVEAHPEMMSSVGSTAMDMLNSSGMEPSKRLPIARTIDAQFSEAAANGMTRQDPQGMYRALSNPELASDDVKNVLKGLSDVQRESVLSKAKSGMSAGYSNDVVNAYRNAGPIEGAKALTAVDKLDQPDDIKAQIRADVEKGLGQWHQEARQAHQQDIMGLEERMASGKPSPSDSALAISLWKSGALTAEQAGETRGRIEKAQEAQVEDTTFRDFAADAYKNGRAIDPKDEGNKKGIDSVFQEQTQGVTPGTAEWINRGADMAAKTGVTPDSIVSWSRAKLIGGDPQSASQGAEALMRMQAANPRGNGYAFDETTKAMAKMINDQVQAGVDPKTAVENSRSIANMTDGQKKRLEELYSANGNAIAKSAQGELTNRLKADPQLKSSFLQSTPVIPPEMVGQFEQLRQNYFKMTNGNVSQSADLAFNDLKNVWGVSKVNGRREYMEFAPESMNPGLTTEFLRQDMENSVKGHTDDPSKAHLIATPETFHSEGQRWALGVPDKFGAYDVVRDARGNPLSYQLPTAQASIMANRDKANKEGLDNLHGLQQNARDQEKDEWETINAERLQHERFGNQAFK